MGKRMVTPVHGQGTDGGKKGRGISGFIECGADVQCDAVAAVREGFRGMGGAHHGEG